MSMSGPTTSSSSSSVPPVKKKHLQNITNISRQHHKKFISPKKNQPALFQYRVKSPSASTMAEDSNNVTIPVTVPLTVPIPVSTLAPIQAPVITNPSQEVLEPFMPNFPPVVIPTSTQKKKETKIALNERQESNWKQRLEILDRAETDKENDKLKKPKRVYSKDMLLSLRANTLSMAPPSPLPSQIIDEYNKVWAKREQEEMELIRKELEQYSISNSKIPSSAWKPKKAAKNYNNSPYSSFPSSPTPSTMPASCPSSIVHPSFAPRSPNKSPYNPKIETNTTPSPSPLMTNETYDAIFNSPFTPPPASPIKQSKKQPQTPQQQSPWDSSCDESSDGEYQWVIQELSARRLETRQKQIDIGKNTTGYQCYQMQVPKEKRKRCDPQTPNIYQVCSKRSWDGQIRKWRRLLHKYDPPGTASPNKATCLMSP